MVNLGKFSKNGGCGFTLKSKELPTQGTDKFILNIKVLKVTNVNPHSKDKEIFLKMNVNGIECDNQELETTKCTFLPCLLPLLPLQLHLFRFFRRNP